MNSSSSISSSKPISIPKSMSRPGFGSGFGPSSSPTHIPIHTSKSYDSKYSQLNADTFEYKLEKKPIGKGSFSSVYLAYDKLGNKFALKRINKSKIPMNYVEKFSLELDILTELNHVNVLKCYEIKISSTHWFIITEYCDGGTLQDVILALMPIDNLKEKENKTKTILKQLVNALKYLNSKNIVHRDLKPMNVLFVKSNPNPGPDSNPNFILKLADFGFAKYFDLKQIDKDGTIDMAGTICGSPIYMAPELLVHSIFNIKCDLWSFGVIMYEMLYGENPYNYPKDIPNLIELINKQKIFIDDIYSSECVDLIKSLLTVDYVKRIGWEQFLSHKWFGFGSGSDAGSDSEFELDLGLGLGLGLDLDITPCASSPGLFAQAKANPNPNPMLIINEQYFTPPLDLINPINRTNPNPITQIKNKYKKKEYVYETITNSCIKLISGLTDLIPNSF